MPLSDQSRHSLSAFTLVELIATVAILAVLVTVSVVFVGGYVADARRVADKQTLAVLNDALNRYKTQGGNITALTSGTPISTVIALLKSEVSWSNLRHQFLQSGFTVPARSLFSKGDRQQYRFTRYNTYTEESGGASPGDLGPNGGNLVGWWKFDESSGTTAADSSGNSHTGTVAGTASFVPSAHGNAINLDGNTAYIQLSPNITFADNAPWTFTAWIYWTNPSGAGPGLAGEGSTYHYLALRDSNLYNRFHYREGGPSYDSHYFGTDSSEDCINNWKHIVFVADGAGNFSLYKDGALFQTLTGLPRTGIVFRYIAAGYSAAGSLFGGQIDEVRIYNRALSAAEVAQIYGM